MDTMQKHAIDYEWVNLIKEAKELGMTLDEIRLFLSNAEQKENT